MSKKLNDELRAKYVAILTEALRAQGEEVLRTGTGTIAIPVVDGEGEDAWVEFTVKIPLGSRDGTPYDGYGDAESYEMERKEKAEKAAANAAKKAAKIARDEKARALRAEAKAKHSENGGN